MKKIANGMKNKNKRRKTKKHTLNITARIMLDHLGRLESSVGHIVASSVAPASKGKQENK